MATLNPILAENAGKKIYVNDSTQEFIVSGYRLVVDPNLNRDTILVTAPTSPNSPGNRGNISFDNNHMYYCIDTNKWVRSKLATWDSQSYVFPIDTGINNIPPPTHWWPFTTNGKSILGNYDFTPQFVGFSSEGARTSGWNGGNSRLLNYQSNIVEPTTNNEDFTISFETKRFPRGYNGLSNSFLMGCPFGKLGFHFGYADKSSGPRDRGDFGLEGDNLVFAFGIHNTDNFNYRWCSVISTGALIGPNYSGKHFLVTAVNKASTKTISLYINGALQETKSYGAPGTMYQNPAYQGFGIGSSPTYPGNSEYNANQIVRNMGFWKGRALTDQQISKIYNTGNFKVYPFV